MRLKTKLILAECPLGKWGQYNVTPAKLKTMQKFVSSLNGRATLTWQEVNQLYGYASELSGTSMKPSTCGPCVAEIIDKMRLTIKERG
jgi:hypothetical protein